MYREREDMRLKSSTRIRIKYRQGCRELLFQLLCTTIGDLIQSEAGDR